MITEIDGYVADCPKCYMKDMAILTRLYHGQAYFECLCGHRFVEPTDSLNVETMKLAREWLWLKKRYPQGSMVQVDVDGLRMVEVVGHKAQTIRDFRPAVRVYVPGRGTMLFGKRHWAF